MEGAGLALNVPAIVAAYDLGSSGSLSDGPVARGRLGSIWRLDTNRGSWAVKSADTTDDEELSEIEDGARFQERALAAGVPTPAVRRTRNGDLIATLEGARVRVHAWVEIDAPRLDLDARGSVASWPHSTSSSSRGGPGAIRGTPSGSALPVGLHGLLSCGLMQRRSWMSSRRSSRG